MHASREQASSCVAYFQSLFDRGLMAPARRRSAAMEKQSRIVRAMEPAAQRSALPRTGRPRSYTPAQMEQAIASVLAQRYRHGSITEACKLFCIPRTALQQRLDSLRNQPRARSNSPS